MSHSESILGSSAVKLVRLQLLEGRQDFPTGLTPFISCTSAGRKGFPGGSVSQEPAMRETHVQSLGWEDPLEKEIATHSCILDWRIPQTEEPGGLQSLGSQRVRHD